LDLPGGDLSPYIPKRGVAEKMLIQYDEESIKASRGVFDDDRSQPRSVHTMIDGLNDR
jgi:hypothetical protein